LSRNGIAKLDAFLAARVCAMERGNMSINWAHAAPTVLAAFFASLVEFVEALIVVLAVGAVRGWRSAIGGAAIALIALSLLVAALGPAITQIPEAAVQFVLGALLLLFGMRWLRKAILRAAGVIPLHDEETLTPSKARCCARRGISREVGIAWQL
jgi:uncharacterized membrane protein